MEDIFGKALPVIQAILPGFITTVIFYWLSSIPKPGQFERLVQALIATGLISIFVYGIEVFFIWIGQFNSLGIWTPAISMAWSIFFAVIIGLTLAYISANDVFYKAARKLRITVRFAEGTEWHFAHHSLNSRSVVLNFKDGRRLAGYPRAWPSDSANGHYLVQFPNWIVNDEYIKAEGIEFMLICVSEIEWVDFLNKVLPEEESSE